MALGQKRSTIELAPLAHIESTTSSLPESPLEISNTLTSPASQPLQPDDQEIFLIDEIIRHCDGPPNGAKKRKVSATTKPGYLTSEEGGATSGSCSSDTTAFEEVDLRHRRYLIKWQGYGHEHNTWEPHANIIQDSPISVQEYNKRLEWKRQRRLRRQGKLSERGQTNELHELKKFLLKNDLNYIVYGKRNEERCEPMDDTEKS